MESVYDFYKPEITSPFPTVDGNLSIGCFQRALDNCYARASVKAEKYLGLEAGSFTLANVDYCVFHSPYNKLVQKSYARLHWNDCRRHPNLSHFDDEARALSQVEINASYNDKALGEKFAKVAADGYKRQVVPMCLLPQNLGNAYNASIFAGLLSLITEMGDASSPCTIMMFAYGSGLCSTMYFLQRRSSLAPIAKLANIKERLSQRIEKTPEEFTATLAANLANYGVAPFNPTGPIEELAPGTYYLTGIDAKHRRSYARKPLA
jgi:hydroxymethylglutaryl-CoA synthase